MTRPYQILGYFAFLLIIGSNTVTAQLQFSQWAFGYQSSIDHTVSPITSAGPTALGQQEGVASIADANGDLLFYTDGSTIWNANHQPMPNGTGLLSSFTCTQAAAIVQDPAACNQYYVFHNGTLPDNDLHWSMVNMDLNNGTGDVVPGQKNILLSINIDEKLTVVRHATDLAYWVLVHGNNTMDFRAYLLTAAGIQPPVVSSIGEVYPAWAFGGQLKASSDGTRLVSLNNQCMVELFDFDATTGIVSNYVPVHQGLSTWNQSIPAWVGRNYYGSEFSPNGQVLYVSGDNFLYQYDLTAGTALDIAATEDLIYGNYQPDMQVYGLQLGPDGRVYVAQIGRNTVAVINNPDALGNACDFDLNGVFIGPGEVRTTFPGVVGYFDNYVQNVSLGPDEMICNGDSIELDPNAAGDHLWSTGATTPSIFVSDPGTYWVEVSTLCGFGTDTIEILPFEAPTVEILDAGVLCQDAMISAFSSNGSTDFMWSTGATTTSIVPSITGSYSVALEHACGVATDTSDVYIMSTPGPGLLSSYEICEDPVLITLMDSSIASATWSDGSFGLEVELFQTGNYDVAVSDTAGCIYQFHFALIEDCPNQLFVPNAFSPNGDGMNDRFQPITNHPEHISYGIYDRWGKNVFQAKDGNIAWDGTINGQLAPVGVYVWVLRMEPSEKTSAQKKTGSVTVIR